MSAKKLIDKYWYMHAVVKLVHCFSVLIKMLITKLEITSR